MGHLIGSQNGIVWDFWFDFSLAEAVLTLGYIVLTLVLLSKIDWTLDKQSLATVIIFISSYICKYIILIKLLVKTVGSFILALFNSSLEEQNQP